MPLLSRIKLALGGAVAMLALGCQSGDDPDQDLLAQEVPLAGSIDGGIVSLADDAEVDAGVHADAGVADAGARAEPPVRLSAGRNAFFEYAEVRANGTGCPRRTWEADLSPDGTLFTVAFSHYEVEVEDGKRNSFKDCTVSVRLHGASDLSYTVTDFYAQGYAYLESGVRGFSTFQYYFQGNPILSSGRGKRVDLTGPVDRSFLFQDAIRTADLVWSPCGLNRNLQVVTRIGLQKTQSKGAGYLNFSSVDGKVEGKIVFRLAARRCASPAQQ